MANAIFLRLCLPIWHNIGLLLKGRFQTAFFAYELEISYEICCNSDNQLWIPLFKSWFLQRIMLIMRIMKKYILPILAVAALAGCESIYVPTLKEVPVRPTNVKKPKADSQVSATGYHLAPSHWADVSKIHDEARRLSTQVSQGSLTKVQAAQYLNRFRIQQVGRNSVDDSMYEVYLRSAVDSQRGEITTEQSKQYIQGALRGWQQRWKNMDTKPSNPAFTNFLMEVMGMQPLK